jgi:glycosyltransferase involved in cell wall biosynthesis
VVSRSPRVTVIMPTYNWATVLPYSIGSALDQTFTDFELLVIGDRCTDESPEVVGAIDDPRVHWHNLDVRTGHQTGPNNEGLRQARGEVIAYLGHDDLWTPRHLELLVGAVDEGAPFVHGRTLLVHRDRRPTVSPRRTTWVYTPGWMPPTTVVHARALVDEVGGWRSADETGTLDPEGELWERMVRVSGTPRLVPRVTSVKIPAIQRRDVYRRRPTHEQAYWLALIRGAADAETSILAATKERYAYATDTWRDRARHAMAEIRSTIRARSRLRALGMLPPATGVPAHVRLRQGRRFKGVED